MQNPVVHFEVLGRDGKNLQAFYRDVFEWKIKNDDGPYNYGEIIPEEGERGITGGIGQTFEGGKPEVTFYIEVEDVDAMLKKALEKGAKVMRPAMEVPGTDVYIAKFADPEGNVIGLVRKR